ATRVRDTRRRPPVASVPMPDDDAGDALPADGEVAEARVRRADLSRAMARLKPRERDLLWLAYAHGSTHKEIAESLGLKTASIKLLLFRARRRLAALLRAGDVRLKPDATGNRR